MENERNKPDCPLIGQYGNVFNLIGIASRTLKENGMASEAKEMSSHVFDSGSYGEALSIISEYVNITSSFQFHQKKTRSRYQGRPNH